MTKFWDKVLKCKHENIDPDYYDYVSCSTPYCTGYEIRCADCGVYITKCGCGACNGMSGWPDKRRRGLGRGKIYGG